MQSQIVRIFKMFIIVRDRAERMPYNRGAGPAEASQKIIIMQSQIIIIFRLFIIVRQCRARLSDYSE